LHHVLGQPLIGTDPAGQRVTRPDEALIDLRQGRPVGIPDSLHQFCVGRPLSRAGSRRRWLLSISPAVEPGGAHRGITAAGALRSPMATRGKVPSGPACSGSTATTGPSGSRGHVDVAGVRGYLTHDTDPSRVTTPPPEG